MQMSRTTEALCTAILEGAAHSPERAAEVLPAVLLAYAMALGTGSRTHTACLDGIDISCRTLRNTATDAFVRKEAALRREAAKCAS